jgi:hypothetical protein
MSQNYPKMFMHLKNICCPTKLTKLTWTAVKICQHIKGDFFRAVKPCGCEIFISVCCCKIIQSIHYNNEDTLVIAMPLKFGEFYLWQQRAVITIFVK